MKINKNNDLFNFNEGKFSFFTGPIAGEKDDQPMDTYDKYDAHAYITGEQAKEQTAILRSISDPEQAAQYKRTAFDFCTFAGTFSVRKNEGLVALSGLMCMDLDDIGGPHAINAVKQTLLADPFFETLLLFISPGGKGLKWVLSVANLCGLSYSMYYKCVEAYLASIGIEADHTSDVVRACFLPYDPECYINMDPGHREYEAFDPKMWLGRAKQKNQKVMPLRKTVKPRQKEKFQVNVPKREGGRAVEVVYTRSGFDYDFSKIEGIARVRRNYADTLTHEELLAKVEDVVSHLEQIGIDPYPKRDQWISLAFQLVAGLGSEGVPFFVRISKLYRGTQTEGPATRYEEIASKGADHTSINVFLNAAEDWIYIHTGEDLSAVNSNETPASLGVQTTEGK